MEHQTALAHLAASLSLNTFGYSELAFRLPTALAALALTGVVARFARRWLGGPLAGLLAGLALLTSKGFVAHHVARTGDYDTLLVLFTTVQVLSCFAWLQTRQPRYLGWLGTAVGLAVLTKGVAGLLLPGLALAVLHQGRLWRLLAQPAAWGAALVAAGLPAGWYFIREYSGPGYWQAVWDNELGGRMLTVLGQHAGPWYWYFIGFASQRFLLWTPWLLAAIWAIAPRPAPRPPRRFLAVAGWAMGGFLLIISAARTKLPWYDAPLYPLLALLIGAGLALLARRVAGAQPYPAARWRAALLLALAVLPSGVALHHRLTRTYAERYQQAELNYGQWLPNPAATPARHLVALHYTNKENIRGYNAALEFHALAYRRQHPHDTLEIRYATANLPPGRVVAVCGAGARQALEQAYHVQVLYALDSCCTLQIQTPRRVGGP